MITDSKINDQKNHFNNEKIFRLPLISKHDTTQLFHFAEIFEI